MADFVIICSDELDAERLYEKTCNHLIKLGSEIKRQPGFLSVTDLTDGDSATFVYGSRDEDPDGIAIPGCAFEQALDDYAKEKENG